MVTSSAGVGASVLRKEDDRFLRGRGQYVADISLPGCEEVAFVRSPHAHARILAIHIPASIRDRVYTAEDLSDVKPIRAATALAGFKHSYEPILSSSKVRYVGELIAMCRARTRAEAEDLVAMIEVEYEELPAITDMAAALEPQSPLVHEEWGDNIFIEIRVDGDVIPLRVPRLSRSVGNFARRGNACFPWKAAESSLIPTSGSVTSP